MFIATTTALENAAAVGSISSLIFASIYGWLILAIGIPLGFILARYIISLFKHGVGKTK